jgi:hypothetical protein
MTSRTYWVLAFLVLAGAGALRLAAASNEFWLDEIWSLRTAVELASASQAFVTRHDNNHILNTLYLRWIGMRDAWIVYRLPSVLAGTGVVALVLACERAERRVAALTTAVLMALSFPLVLYSAEARGYIPMLFCALASFYALERFVERPRMLPLLAFWTSALVGALFHASYLQAYLALLGWSVVLVFRMPGGPVRAAGALAAFHALPAAALSAFYVLFVRDMVVGGGPSYEPAEVLREAAAYTLGFPQMASMLALAATIVIVFWSLAITRREPIPRWPFFTLILVVAPLVVLATAPTGVLYFRDFLVQILFFYLLAGAALALLWQRGGLGQGAYVLLMLWFVVVQSPPLWRLATTGRLGCVETVRYLGAHTDGPDVVVGSDQEFRNQLMLWYFGRFLPTDKHLRYVERRRWTRRDPEWILVHNLGPVIPQPPAVQSDLGTSYDLRTGFECGGAERWSWSIYHRVARSSAAPPPSASTAVAP